MPTETNPSPAQQVGREYLASGGGSASDQVPRAKGMVLVPGGRTSITESAKRLFEEVAEWKELFY
jgi:hypothetical protein